MGLAPPSLGRAAVRLALSVRAPDAETCERIEQRHPGLLVSSRSDAIGSAKLLELDQLVEHELFSLVDLRRRDSVRWPTLLLVLLAASDLRHAERGECHGARDRVPTTRARHRQIIERDLDGLDRR